MNNCENYALIILIMFLIVYLGMMMVVGKSCKTTEKFASTYGTRPLEELYYSKNSPMRCGRCSQKVMYNSPRYVSNENNPLYYNEGRPVGNCNFLTPPQMLACPIYTRGKDPSVECSKDGMLHRQMITGCDCMSLPEYPNACTKNCWFQYPPTISTLSGNIG